MTEREKRARRRQTARNAHVRRTYGLTDDQYAALKAAQNGQCAICERTPRYQMAVDHCHATGRVRGLLCKLCNGRVLPSVRDNPETLRRAAAYLENPPAFAVIGEHYVPETEAA